MTPKTKFFHIDLGDIANHQLRIVLSKVGFYIGLLLIEHLDPQQEYIFKAFYTSFKITWYKCSISDLLRIIG